jgi:hypothetical protein
MRFSMVGSLPLLSKVGHPGTVAHHVEEQGWDFNIASQPWDSPKS